MLRVLTAEADRWNLAKLILGVVCTFALARAMLAVSVLLGLAGFSNAHPGINAAPLQNLILGILWAVVAALAFRWCEGRRVRGR